MAELVQDKQDIALLLDYLAHICLCLGRVHLSLELALGVHGGAFGQVDLFRVRGDGRKATKRALVF